MRKTLAATALAIAIVGMSAGAAVAAEGDDYTPETPPTLTLAGSTAATECVGDVPWIDYSVEMTDPDNLAKGHTAFLRLSDGANQVDLALGALKADNTLSGRILWPGASVDAQGNGTGWPGWAFVDGAWVETTGNFAWTRGPITATLHVNPELVVPLSYPKATAACANPTGLLHQGATTGALAMTGGTVSLVAAGVGVGALALGLGLTLRRRRAQR